MEYLVGGGLGDVEQMPIDFEEEGLGESNRGGLAGGG